MKTIDEIHRANMALLVKEYGVTGMAEKLRKSNSQVSQWLNGSKNSGTGKPRGMSPGSCRAIEVTFNRPTGWMDQSHSDADDQPEISRDDEIVTGAQRMKVAEPGDAAFVHIKKVKLRLSAGVTGFQADPEFDSGGSLALDPRWVIRNGFSPDRLIAIKVKGESMEPALYEDDLVVLNTADTKMVDGLVYAVNYEGEAVIKRLSRDAGEWWLTSDNPDQRKYHRKLCRGSDCIVVGRVVRKESDKI